MKNERRHHNTSNVLDTEEELTAKQLMRTELESFFSQPLSNHTETAEEQEFPSTI